jgi:hypothetical protein
MSWLEGMAQTAMSFDADWKFYLGDASGADARSRIRDR